MAQLPAASAYRLAFLLSRERRLLEEQMVRAAQGLSPLYAFMPAFLLRHWCHEVLRAVIAALIEGDLRPAYTYAVTVIRVAQRVGRSPDLIRKLVGIWCGVISPTVDAAFAAEPETHAEATAILQLLLDLTEQALTTVYDPESAARELLQWD